MAFPSVTNVDGSNPGPNSTVLPDTVQMPTGNLWKMGVFNVTLSPATIAMSSAVEQVFTSVGIGLTTGDIVFVSSNQTNNGIGIVNARVSSYDTLNITFVNPTPATGTPSTTASYAVFVIRPQPNWSKPASGSQLDW